MGGRATAIRNRQKIILPSTAQQTMFVQAWLSNGFDLVQAAVTAGYKRAAASKVARRLSAYMEEMRQKLENEVVKQVALEQKDIIEEMMAIGFANPLDYAKEIVLEVDGKPVKHVIRKPLLELTRRQAAAISKVIFHPDGTVTYELPDEKSKHPYLKDLGQHLGLFHPKLIQEHRHAHLHAKLDMRDADSEKLAEAERMYMEALGSAGKRLLGVTGATDEE